MKQDALEKRIRELREALDHTEKVPAEKMWAAVQREVTRPGPSPVNTDWQIGRNWKMVLLVASMALLVGLALWLFQPQPEPGPDFRLAEVYPELAQQEDDYMQLISDKENELRLEELDESDFEMIFQELEELETTKTATWKDLEVQPEKEELVGILMRYYERKLLVLDRLQKEIDRHEMQKQRDEKIAL